MNGREKLVGILGSVIIHLTAGIIFMLLKIGSLDIEKYRQEYEIIFYEEKIPEEILKEARSGGKQEDILAGDQELLNIARNLAAKPDFRINPEEYIDRVKEEMIKSGLLGPDNYIDEQKRMRAEASEKGIEVHSDEKGKEEQVSKSNEMAARYSGPTRIYYYLPGRTHVYLPLPIYKCEGGGKVTLAIEVNPEGKVVKASIITGESTTSDPCLTEAAVISSLSSRFSPDASAIKNQTGTLTYHFVPQWQED